MMRWKRYIKRDHETRFKTKFAILPVRIQEDVRWLESVTILQEWHSATSTWKDIKFADADEIHDVSDMIAEVHSQKRYFIYGNSGGIGKVIEELQHPEPEHVFKYISDILRHISNRFECDIEDLSIEYYDYDFRLQKYVYMICTTKCGYETYDYPQFASFMVEI